MRELNVSIITEKLENMIKKSLVSIECEALSILENIKCTGLEAWAKDQIVRNAYIAKETNSYACQDTGLAVIFLGVGQDIHLVGGDITEAINEGVRRGYKEARKSILDPMSRINTKDNTPAVIYMDIVEGDKIKLSYLAKGAGSENMSKIYMLTPSKGEKGIIGSVVDCVIKAGANPCPPIVIGVGIGGTFDKAAVLSKKALLRPTNGRNEDKELARLETEIIDKVNATKIGIAGLKGDTTCLNVSVLKYPTHIGMLPVAVNIQCHSIRHDTIII